MVSYELPVSPSRCSHAANGSCKRGRTMWRVSSLAIWCMRSMKTRHLPAQWDLGSPSLRMTFPTFQKQLETSWRGGKWQWLPPPQIQLKSWRSYFFAEENQNGPSPTAIYPPHPTPTISNYILPSGKLTWQWKIALFEDVWTLLNMGIFQPAMLVYRRVLHKPQAKAGIGAGTSRFRALLFKASADWLGVVPCSLQRDA